MVTSPERGRKVPAAVADDEPEKTEEEKAEEKKKMDVMRKFYRNRHHTFLQALV